MVTMAFCKYELIIASGLTKEHNMSFFYQPTEWHFAKP
jgi:hypothetical protein